MAFHPQTDGLSERKNQWVEQYLHLVTSAALKDWTQWLVLATAVHNNQKNLTTRLSPNQIILGYDLKLNPAITTPSGGLLEPQPPPGVVFPRLKPGQGEA